MIVPIVNDEVFENTENLSISLGTPSDSRITVMPSEGVIEIEDDDGKSSVLVYRLTHPMQIFVVIYTKFGMLSYRGIFFHSQLL